MLLLSLMRYIHAELSLRVYWPVPWSVLRLFPELQNIENISSSFSFYFYFLQVRFLFKLMFYPSASLSSTDFNVSFSQVFLVPTTDSAVCGPLLGPSQAPIAILIFACAFILKSKRLPIENHQLFFSVTLCAGHISMSSSSPFFIIFLISS